MSFASTPQRLLAADLDGTVLGDDLGERQFSAWFAQHPEVCLAYVSGRQLESVQELIANGRIPQPHFIASSVGSALWDCTEPTNRLGRAYARLAGSGWNKPALIAAASGPGVRDQAQRGLQVDYHAAFSWDGRPESLAALQDRLSGFPDIVVVASHGAYIDVLPASLGKGAVVSFLLDQREIAAKNALVAGDSENDLALFDLDLPTILPANACPAARQHKNAARFYCSPLNAGQGLVDGLHHFWD